MTFAPFDRAPDANALADTGAAAALVGGGCVFGWIWLVTVFVVVSKATLEGSAAATFVGNSVTCFVSTTGVETTGS
jgi:hypothetical protein